MPRKVNFETTNELTLKGIVGFVKRKVTPHGTGAKVTCPKEYLGKTVYLVITEEPWEPTQEVCNKDERTKMSEHVNGLNRDQTALFPDTLEEIRG